MIALKTLHRTPYLAELKVTYRRGKPKDAGQAAFPFAVASPMCCEKYLRSMWDMDAMDLREEFVLVCLNNSLEVLGWIRLSSGGMAATAVDLRILFGVALQVASAAIIVAHNHPSGSPTPSREDIDVTRRIANGAKLLDIRLLEHVILTRENCYFFSESMHWHV